MTNIDRAAEHLDSLDRLYGYASGQKPTNAVRAQALADNGYLMPDLPEPVENQYTHHPSWFNGWVEQNRGEVELHHNGYANGEEETTLTAEEARDLALALLAAADHTERNCHEPE